MARAVVLAAVAVAVAALLLCAVTPPGAEATGRSRSRSRRRRRRRSSPSVRFDGGVYAMTNELDGNKIAAYGRRDDGTLQFLAKYATGGLGGDFDGPEGLDPLISAYAVQLTRRNDYLLAVNAGSSSITVFHVNKDSSLTKTDVAPTYGTGPNSIAIASNGQVFVTNIDADGQFQGEPDQEGSLVSYRLKKGKLLYEPHNHRRLGNRPSAVRVGPNGKTVVVASINAGSAALASGSNDEIVLFRLKNRRLSARPADAAFSTAVNNAQGRNLASAIGFEIVRDKGRFFVVVTEAREFQADGAPPAFPALQTGSVSVWEIVRNRELRPLQLDVIPPNRDITNGERTACWIEFTRDQRYFWSVNALDASITTYSFDEGKIAVSDELAAQGNGAESSDPATAFGETDGWIDVDTDRRGRYLYQLFGLAGRIGVYRVGAKGALSRIETVSGNLPTENTQGIVAF